MIVESKTVAGLKEQLSKFSRIISKEFNKAKRRLIQEMLYGIKASKDVKKQYFENSLKKISSSSRPKTVWCFGVTSSYVIILSTRKDPIGLIPIIGRTKGDVVKFVK